MLSRFWIKEKKSKKKKMNNFVWFFLFRKTFIRNLFFQNVFWIDCGSGKHKKKFLKVESGKVWDKLRHKSE